MAAPLARAGDNDADIVAQAKSLYDEGTSYFDHAEYEKAVAKLLESYSLKPLTETLLALGQAYKKMWWLGTSGTVEGREADRKKAILHYERYVNEMEALPDAEDHKAEISQIKSQIGDLKHGTPPPLASAAEITPESTPDPPPAAKEEVPRAAPPQPAARPPAPDEGYSLMPRLPPPKREEVHQPVSDRAKVLGAGIPILIVGVGCVVGSIVAAVQSQSISSQIEQSAAGATAWTTDLDQRVATGNQLHQIALGLGITGGVLTAAGVITTAVGASMSSPAVTLAPSVSPRSMGLTLGGRF